MRARKLFRLQARDKTLQLGLKTRVMGIVNLTPDSFYDGGRYFHPHRAVERCLQLVEEGAEILDLGGESSRPGAQPLPAAEEIGRVIPVLSQLRSRVSVMVSVDTYKSEVARAALEHGADMINDISAFRLDRRMPEVVAEFGAGLICMSMRGTPRTMQKIPPSEDILGETLQQLKKAVQTAYSHQICRDRIVLDPGIGFGKTARDNLLVLNRLPFLEELDLPVLVGTSRKSFLGKILQLPEKERLFGTAASVVVSLMRGAHIVRVHDVREMRMVADVADAILAESLER